MDKNTYLSKRYDIVVRLKDAMKCRCWLTANARCRELARLKTEFDGTPYKTNLIEIMNEFNVLQKQSESRK